MSSSITMTTDNKYAINSNVAYIYIYIYIYIWIYATSVMLANRVYMNMFYF